MADYEAPSYEGIDGFFDLGYIDGERFATGAKMRRFTMFRRNVPDETHDANQKNPPDEPQFEGVVFTDGSVAIRWRTAKRSTSLWDSLEDMLAIHGHPEYGSELVWHDA